MRQTHASGAHRVAVSTTVADPVYQAFMLLRTGFTVLPILFGADKFFNAMVNWERYLAPAIPKGIGVTPELFAWLWLIIANLVMTGQYWDIALRDFGLSVGALVLGRLALAVHRR